MMDYFVVESYCTGTGCWLGGMERCSGTDGYLRYSPALRIYRQVQLDSGIVRGLDYYTGPVFEAQLDVSGQE